MSEVEVAAREIEVSAHEMHALQRQFDARRSVGRIARVIWDNTPIWLTLLVPVALIIAAQSSRGFHVLGWALVVVWVAWEASVWLTMRAMEGATKRIRLRLDEARQHHSALVANEDIRQREDSSAEEHEEARRLSVQRVHEALDKVFAGAPAEHPQADISVVE